jgi:hypothetical protein
MKTISFAALLSILFAASMLVAQEPPKTPPPQKEHEWLKQFVGEWETAAEAPAGPGQPAFKCKGTMSSRMLGGYWVVSESKADLAGTQMNAIQTIGYNPQTKKYVGSWVDSMFNHFWKYEGSVDSTGKVLTLEAEGPNFMAEGKTATFRDIYEFKSKDHIVSSSQMQGEDGKWITIMTGNITRKK